MYLVVYEAYLVFLMVFIENIVYCYVLLEKYC